MVETTCNRSIIPHCIPIIWHSISNNLIYIIPDSTKDVVVQMDPIQDLEGKDSMQNTISVALLSWWKTKRNLKSPRVTNTPACQLFSHTIRDSSSPLLLEAQEGQAETGRRRPIYTSMVEPPQQESHQVSTARTKRLRYQWESIGNYYPFRRRKFSLISWHCEKITVRSCSSKMNK